MNNDSFPYFPYFPKFPPEIRRHVWHYCLPHRTAEEDVPCFLLDGGHSRQACWANGSTYENARLPAIASVNRESRQLALEHGRKWEPPDLGSLKSLWVQPGRDVLLLNFTRWRYVVTNGNRDAGFSPVLMFLWRAEDHRMKPCVVAEILHPFRLKAILDGDDASKIPCLLLVNGIENEEATELVDYIECIQMQKIDLGIAMVAVSLHITTEAALGSGLFGLLGDAPVQMVDFDDEDRLKQFHALYNENALDKEPAVRTLFETFLSPRFQTAVETWVRQAEWLILAYMWLRARDDKDCHGILGMDPSSAWAPRLEDPGFISMKKHLPNDDHPWVKQARQKMPKLRPQIMVRCCTHKCYTGERLPDYYEVCCGGSCITGRNI